MDIKLVWDSSVANAPAGFEPAMQAAASALDALITNNITVNINVGYGEYTEYTPSGTFSEPLSGTESEGGIGEGPLLTYSQLVSDLSANAESAVDKTAVADLPTSDPTDGGYFLVSDAQEKAWGVMANGGTEIDGSVGFGAGGAYDYSLSDNTVAPPDNELDFLGIAEHELTHALGRFAGLQLGGAGDYATQDLFRYTAAGKLALSAATSALQQETPAYFSANGGVTDLGAYSTSEDLGDWTATTIANDPFTPLPDDSFDATSYEGAINKLSATDATMMNLLGFQVACFAAGTRIATPGGSVAVEALRVGDAVALAGGGSAPVIWLGHRRFDCRRHPRPHDVCPIRVQAHAFAPGQPARDVYLSPDHAVSVRGALIPIRYLLNGATVAQMPAGVVEYWHVELPAHAVLLAEGLPAESYLDTGNRGAFAGETAGDLHPDFARRVWRARGCAPLHLRGPRVRAARRRLLARAAELGHSQTEDAGLAVAAAGHALPIRREGGRCIVRLPAGVARVRLRSRAWVPAHMDPRTTDTRRLGVAVGRLWLDATALALDSPALEQGWHAVEQGWRWTDGDAGLATGGARELAFEIVPMGRFWQTQAPPAARRSATA